MAALFGPSVARSITRQSRRGTAGLSACRRRRDAATPAAARAEKWAPGRNLATPFAAIRRASHPTLRPPSGPGKRRRRRTSERADRSTPAPSASALVWHARALAGVHPQAVRVLFHNLSYRRHFHGPVDASIRSASSNVTEDAACRARDLVLDAIFCVVERAPSTASRANKRKKSVQESSSAAK